MAAVARPRRSSPCWPPSALPLVGLFFFRLYDNQLIRQTQAELIAQSRVLAAIYAREVEARLDSGLDARRRAAAGRAARPRRPGHRRSAPRSTSPPTICLLRRPDAQPRRSRRSPAYVEIGATLTPIILRDAEGDAGGLSHPRSQRRGHRRARRRSGSRSPISRRSRDGAARAIPRRPAHPHARQAAAADLFLQPRRSACTCSRRCRCIVNNHVAGVIYTSRTPSNIFDHLYQERGKFMLAAIAVILGTIADRPRLLAHHHAADARADRPRRRGSRRGDRDAFQPLAALRHARIRRSCRTAFSAWPSSWRGAPTTSRPSRPISPTS